MSKKKKDPESINWERVHHLCYQSRLGYRPTDLEMVILQEAFESEPEKYSRVRKAAADEADGTVNPFR